MTGDPLTPFDVDLYRRELSTLEESLTTTLRELWSDLTAQGQTLHATRLAVTARHAATLFASLQATLDTVTPPQEHLL
jgi:hypothetical protein